MKILVVCQHYYPDPFRITDIAKQLVTMGHEVFVLAGTPSYEHEKWLADGGKIDEVYDGVTIHRVKTVARSRGVVNRFRNYYSYAINSKRFVKRLDRDFDVVFAYEVSPVMMIEAAVKYKRKYGAKLVTYCLDIWPKCLTAGGIKERSPIYAYYRRLSKRLYSASDELLVTSQSFKDYFAEEFGFDTSGITYLPQYAESVYSPETCKKEPNGVYDFLFAGNVGVAQSVETIIEAANLLRDDERIKFHIVGDGVRLEVCRDLAESLGLNNVEFYGRLPLESMPETYAKADAMLVTGDNGVVSQTLPAKVQGYMAAAKPIIGAIGGETARVISDANCGYCGAATDAEALRDNVLKFVDASDKSELGDNGYRYYRENFPREKFFADLTTILERCRK